MEDAGDVESSKTVNKKVVIQIPSYLEVSEGFSNPSASTSLSQSSFKPTQTFSQAFKFIKNSEFYVPPPPAASTSSVPSDTVSVSQSLNQVADATANSSSNQTSTPSSSILPVRGRRSILVSQRQKGNPLLKHIRNVKWEFSDIVCDYLLGQNSCALYLSLRYHLLHPDYIYYRIRELQKNYRLRVILCHVDVDDVAKPLLEVTKTALLHDCTLLCAWSLEECGRYLETLKMYENKPADLIQGQMDTDYLSRLNHVLTSVRRVNKTDVVTLGSTFGVSYEWFWVFISLTVQCLASVMGASMEDLARCPGIGERKVKSLYDTFHEPFKRKISRVVENGSMEKNEEGLEKKASDKEEGNDGIKRRKESVLTVKSALSAAFAKHGSKLNIKGNNRMEGSSQDSSVHK